MERKVAVVNDCLFKFVIFVDINHSYSIKTKTINQ